MLKNEQSNRLIVKANKLIETSNTHSTFELRIIHYALSFININDTSFKNIQIYIPEFRKILGIQQSYNNQDIKIKLKELSDKYIVVSNSNIITIRWLEYADIDFDRSLINLQFNPQLSPYLLQLRSCFTKYNLSSIIKFRFKYSFKMYELLKQYEKLKYRIIEISNLRFFLGISPGKYKLYKNFRIRILEPVYKEINEFSDISYKWEEITRGRKVIALKFLIYSKTRLEADKKLDEVVLMLPSKYHHRNSLIKELDMYYRNKGSNYVIRNIQYARKHCKSNFPVFLIMCLEKDFGIAIKEDRLAKEHQKKMVEDRLKQEEIDKKKEQARVEKEKAEALKYFYLLPNYKQEEILIKAEKTYGLFKHLSKEDIVWFVLSDNS